MIQINKRLTSFVWYAAPLDLTTSFAWKSRIRSLRRINPAGAGYVSFDPSRPANSLTLVQTGDVLTLDATGITSGSSATYFDVDNGDVPPPRVNPDTVALTVPAGLAGRVTEYPATWITRPALITALASSYYAPTEVRFNNGPYMPLVQADNYMNTNIPASDFNSGGPGCLLQFRVTMADASVADQSFDFLLEY